jgi:hypothetical protein
VGLDAGMELWGKLVSKWDVYPPIQLLPAIGNGVWQRGEDWGFELGPAGYLDDTPHAVADIKDPTEMCPLHITILWTSRTFIVDDPETNQLEHPRNIFISSGCPFHHQARRRPCLQAVPFSSLVCNPHQF